MQCCLGRGNWDSGDFANQIVLAYELPNLAHRGVFDASLKIEDYSPDSGFLGDDAANEQDDRKEDSGIGVGLFTVENVQIFRRRVSLLGVRVGEKDGVTILSSVTHD